jgi:hypothetical protein
MKSQLRKLLPSDTLLREFKILVGYWLDREWCPTVCLAQEHRNDVKV